MGVGKRRKLARTLHDMDKKNPFQYEILSSIKKDDSCKIFGAVKCDKNCPEIDDKIQDFFDESLEDAVIKAFGYTDEYNDKFDFGLRVTIGFTKETNISREAQEFVPQILNNYTDWNAMKNDVPKLNDKIINKLKNEFNAIQDQKENETGVRTLKLTASLHPNAQNAAQDVIDNDLRNLFENVLSNGLDDDLAKVKALLLDLNGQRLGMAMNDIVEV